MLSATEKIFTNKGNDLLEEERGTQASVFFTYLWINYLTPVLLLCTIRVHA